MRRIWSLEEARAVLPQVIEITENSIRQSGVIAKGLEDAILPENEQERREDELQAILNKWAASVMELGGEVKGLWLVDFDNGQGYWCWKFGEDNILFEHDYETGFQGRRPIEADDGAHDEVENA